MKRPSESSFLDIRGLRYHVRRWPHPGAPKLVLLHGWMDVSASFQFVVDELRERPQLRPYPDFAALEERLRAGNARLTAERAHFLARHWGREDKEGKVVLRGDPAHKIVNPQLYRYEEALACWRQVVAPVLWVEGAESGTARRMKIDAADIAERRAAFRDLRLVTVPDAGHMLHHDQPQAVAALIDDFIGR